MQFFKEFSKMMKNSKAFNRTLMEFMLGTSKIAREKAGGNFLGTMAKFFRVNGKLERKTGQEFGHHLLVIDMKGNG
jgi:hypothetical protein